jgi:hypothetical protein
VQLTDLLTGVASVIQDAANKLSANDRAAAVQQAILQRYSKDHPLQVVIDIPGNGTSDLPLPEGYEDGFSYITQVEYPGGQVPAECLQDFEWQMYRAPSGLVVRLLVDVPAADEMVRMSFTQRHAPDASTIYPQDQNAVIDLSASYCFEALAAIYAQTGNNSIAADVVNYRTKGQEYLALAKAARKRYCSFFGIPEDGNQEAIAKPALVVAPMTQLMGTGVDRLTHQRPR